MPIVTTEPADFTIDINTLYPTTQFCKLREWTLPCEWHHGTVQFIRSQKRLRDERARVKGLVRHPYSACVYYWGCLHMTLTFAALYYIPFQVFINCPNPYDPFILITDLIAFVNLCLSFVTGYIADDNKAIVLEPKLIAIHYLRTRFLPDLIGSLPLQLIEIFDNCQYPSHTAWYIFKLFRLFTLTKEWNCLLSQLELSYIKKEVMTVIAQMIIFLHWMTYIHYQVPCITVHYFVSDERFKKWIMRFNVVDIKDSSVFHKYTANLFLVSGLAIGSGYYSPVDEHLVSELLLTSSIGLIGLLFLTYAFTTLLQLAMFLQYEKNLFTGRTLELKEYMAFKRLPEFLQRKIMLFINYKFNGHYFNEEIIMNTINEQIRQDINMYGCKRLVMSVPLFQDMPIALIHSIIFRLTQVLYMPGELLVQCGQPGTSLYMISSGTVALISSTGREIAHLRDGSYFGETALLHPGTPRTVTVIALEITEIYKLENKEFQMCMQPYPHLKRRLEESYIKRRLALAHR